MTRHAHNQYEIAPHPLRRWFEGDAGRLMRSAERDVLRARLPNIFGYHALEIGCEGGGGCSLEASRIRNRVRLCTSADGRRDEYASVCGSMQSLPIASDSVDVVVLPHLLEYEREPHAVLREAERVLMPEGHLLVSAFNPWSLLGVRRLFSACRPARHWQGHFFSETRIRDWLALLGFEILSVDRFFYRPPFGHEHMLGKLEFLERSGARFWPIFSGCYLLLAKKRVATLTPLPNRWRPRRQLSGAGIMEPSTRIAKQ